MKFYLSFFTSADISSVSNLTLVGTGPVLTLSNVNSSVGGTYYCVVVNEAGFGSDTVNLYITPKMITHPVGINTVVGGSSRTMTCMADSFPDSKYCWEKRSTLEDEYSEVPDSEGSLLEFDPISNSNKGYYRCIAYTNVSSIVNETASNPATLTGK